MIKAEIAKGFRGTIFKLMAPGSASREARLGKSEGEKWCSQAQTAGRDLLSMKSSYLPSAKIYGVDCVTKRDLITSPLTFSKNRPPSQEKASGIKCLVVAAQIVQYVPWSVHALRVLATQYARRPVPGFPTRLAAEARGVCHGLCPSNTLVLAFGSRARHKEAGTPPWQRQQDQVPGATGAVVPAMASSGQTRAVMEAPSIIF